MKTLIISALSLAFVGIASADVPRKQTLQSYSSLWEKSPFTTPPPPPEIMEKKNPLEDYALIGVSPIGGNKYRVTMINKKQPDERKMVYSDVKDAEFQIIKVTRKTGDPLGTVVTMKSGSQVGTVSYEEKLLTLAAPPVAKPSAPNPGQPPMPAQAPVDPNQPRMPRPRVVPPPTPPVPQPQVQGQQAHPPTNNQRPDRRHN